MAYQLMFYVDLNRCINCKTCEMACNQYYGLTDIHRRNVITYKDVATAQPVHLSISCNHCKNPVCVYICPENNFQKRIDGIVVHSPSHCQACMRCVTACPFHAPKLNPKTNRVDKCNFCVERIDLGKKPICVEKCITGALSIIKVNQENMNSIPNSGNVPIAKYTKPSIIVTEKKVGKNYLRT